VTVAEPKPLLPSIAYVDESEDERSNFHGDAIDSELFDQIITLHPDDKLEDLVAKLVELRIDALISDFNLSDAGPKTYTGAEVVEAFLRVRNDFPCFIMTSYAEDAMISSSDVNRVYSKDRQKEQSTRRNLFKRISYQVDHHRARLEEWEAEFDALAAIAPDALTAPQADRLLHLDSLLEAHFSADQAVAGSIKRQLLDRNGLFEKRDELIGETEKLIDAMKRALDE
jgi:hypothetical protein